MNIVTFNPGQINIPQSVEEFHQLKARSEDTIVIIKFGAEWCDPCQKIKPGVTALAKQMPQYIFIEANVDNENLNELADFKDIRTIPTFKIYKNGSLAGQTGGDLSALVRTLNQLA